MRIKTVAVLAALASVALVGTAYAHAHLVSSIPEGGGTVKTAPKTVTINFTEALEAKASTIRVEDAKGTEVDKADSHVNPKSATTLIVDLKPLPAGTYKVIWNATATDTHKTHGAFNFTVSG